MEDLCYNPRIYLMVVDLACKTGFSVTAVSYGYGMVCGEEVGKTAISEISGHN